MVCNLVCSVISTEAAIKRWLGGPQNIGHVFVHRLPRIARSEIRPRHLKQPCNGTNNAPICAALEPFPGSKPRNLLELGDVGPLQASRSSPARSVSSGSAGRRRTSRCSTPRGCTPRERSGGQLGALKSIGGAPGSNLKTRGWNKRPKIGAQASDLGERWRHKRFAPCPRLRIRAARRKRRAWPSLRRPGDKRPPHRCPKPRCWGGRPNPALHNVARTADSARAGHTPAAGLPRRPTPRRHAHRQYALPNAAEPSGRRAARPKAGNRAPLPQAPPEAEPADPHTGLCVARARASPTHGNLRGANPADSAGASGSGPPTSARQTRARRTDPPKSPRLHRRFRNRSPLAGVARWAASNLSRRHAR